MSEHDENTTTPPSTEQPAFSDFGAARPPVQRLSRLAVLSLGLGAAAAGGFCLLVAVIALIFGVSGGLAELPLPVLLLPPLLGSLATLTAVIALVRITRSGGTIGGAGFCLGGIVLGLLATMIAAGIAIGASQMAQGLSGNVNGLLEAIEMDQVDTVRRYTTARTAERLSAERLEEFQATWETALGAFDRGPRSAGEFRAWEVDVAGAMKLYEQIDPGPQFIPVPAAFAQEKGVVVLHVRTLGFDTQLAGEIVNVGIFTNAGRQIWMIDPAELAEDAEPQPGTVPRGQTDVPDGDGP